MRINADFISGMMEACYVVYNGEAVVVNRQFFIVALSLVVRTAERICSVICKFDSATTAKLFIVDFYENNC